MTGIGQEPRRSGIGPLLLRGVGVLVFSTLWLLAAQQVLWAYFDHCDTQASKSFTLLMFIVMPFAWVGFNAAASIGLWQVRKGGRLRIALVVVGVLVLTWIYWWLVTSVLVNPVYVDKRCGGGPGWWFLP